jgi:translation initiation factor IF-1
MDLYKLSNGQKLEVLESTKFDLERDIQSVIEKNTQELFNLQFVKSELTIHNYRIDSLCFDQELKSFVILEYKKTQSYSVIDQGFTYLSTMLNNKSDFVLEYNETTGSNLKRDEIDWSQSRVIFISPAFSQYQRDSVNFKDIPFELWEVKKFGNDLIGLNQLFSTSKESVKGIEKSKDIVLSEVQVVDEESVLEKTPENIKKIYEELKDGMSLWGDISFKSKQNYISVLRGNKVKIYLNPQKNQLKIDMLRKVDFTGNVKSVPTNFTLDDPKKMFTLFENQYKELYTLSIKDIKNIDYILLMMKQKFDS